MSDVRAKSVLFSSQEVNLVDPRGRAAFDGRFLPEDFVPAIETALSGASEDGTVLAARLLLSRCATVINFVNTDVIGSRWEGDEPALNVQIQLGFNDHLGGSESNFKILVNRHMSHEDPEQYVLLSPPNADGSPSNTAFHRSGFAFPSLEPEPAVEFPDFIPNSLKTSGVSQYQGYEGYYNHFLFGDSETPVRFCRLFEAVGFTFVPRPYDQQEVHRLHDLEDAANKHLSYADQHLWPGPQFATQMALLSELDPEQ